MKEKTTKKKNKTLAKKALKWGTIGFIIGVLIPFIVPTPDSDYLAPIGIFPTIITLGLLDKIFGSILIRKLSALRTLGGRFSVLFLNGLVVAIVFVVIFGVFSYVLDSHKNQGEHQ